MIQMLGISILQIQEHIKIEEICSSSFVHKSFFFTPAIII